MLHFFDICNIFISKTELHAFRTFTMRIDWRFNFGTGEANFEVLT